MGLNFLVFDAGEESICGDFMAKINGRPKFFYSKCQRSGLISHSYFPSDVVQNEQKNVGRHGMGAWLSW
jgi:hypothetical protein